MYYTRGQVLSRLKNLLDFKASVNPREDIKSNELFRSASCDFFKFLSLVNFKITFEKFERLKRYFSDKDFQPLTVIKLIKNGLNQEEIDGLPVEFCEYLNIEQNYFNLISIIQQILHSEIDKKIYTAILTFYFGSPLDSYSLLDEIDCEDEGILQAQYYFVITSKLIQTKEVNSICENAYEVAKAFCVETELISDNYIRTQLYYAGLIMFEHGKIKEAFNVFKKCAFQNDEIKHLPALYMVDIPVILTPHSGDIDPLLSNGSKNEMD